MIKTVHDLWHHLRLAKTYKWDVPVSSPVAIPAGIKSPFGRNIYLKNNFFTSLVDPSITPISHASPIPINWKYFFWIIQDWGGIKSYKDNTDNRTRIATFFRQLTTGNTPKLTKDSHDRLPSLSKLAAFKYPAKYSIYDSRAVFSLNWLLYCHCPNTALFPQPPGRSKSLTEFDTQTLFRLSRRLPSIRSHKTAYFEYCDMLECLSRVALGIKNQPFYLEMLLFVAADQWIPNDIKKRTTVTIIRPSRPSNNGMNCC